MATIISSSQSLHLLNPKTPFSSIPRTTKPFSFNPLSPPPPTFSLHRLNHHQPPPPKPYLLKIKATSTASPPSPSPSPPPPPPTVLASIRDSTRTISAIITTVVVLSKLVTAKIQSNLAKLSDATPEELNSLDSLRRSLVCSGGPLFFAAVSSGGGRGSVNRGLNTPLTVVAAGMGRWLEIYAGVLLVRVLLSWFPNIPWDRQPLSAIRDLCDPYLNLFRNIIPPILGTLDISPIFAFTVLGVLGGLMRGAATSAMY